LPRNRDVLIITAISNIGAIIAMVADNTHLNNVASSKASRDSSLLVAFLVVLGTALRAIPAIGLWPPQPLQAGFVPSALEKHTPHLPAADYPANLSECEER
jgi:hypothetical protein